MSTGIILIEEEPLESALCTWLSWMTLMVIFAMSVIYLSNYFVKSSECMIVNEYHTGIPVQDLKNAKWRKRFTEIDKKWLKSLEGSKASYLESPEWHKKRMLSKKEKFTVSVPFTNNVQIIKGNIDQAPAVNLSNEHYYLY